MQYLRNRLLDEAGKDIEKRNEELSLLNEALSEEKARVQEINKNLEEKVEERTAALKKHNKKLKEYAFFNAHRFRGPVANILGLVNLIQSADYQLDEKLKFVQKLGQAGKQLDHSIHEIQFLLHEANETEED